MIAIGAWFFVGKKTYDFGSGAQTKALIDQNGVYTNSKYKFKATLPKGYSVREVGAVVGSDSQSDTILFENGSGDGIQILVTPYDDIKELTSTIIRKDIPDMTIIDEQIVEVGSNYKGLAFKSDNPAFGGDSREVWLVFRGNLYQISAYAKMDSVLKTIFATWQFL